ncbi:MAG: EamA family transporter [Candidatus Dormiibacterota bacterium]
MGQQLSSTATSTPFLLITGVVLLAGVLHAIWNAIAHGLDDKLVTFTWISVVDTVLGACLLHFVAWPARAAWPFLLASAALHVVYNGLLMQAYRLGDFNQAYPLARGTSPWVVAIVGTLVVGERLGLPATAGVIVVSAGLASLVFAGGTPSRGELPALGAAFATGLAIAGYTVLDGIGVRLSHSVPGYVAWLFLLQGPVIPTVAWLRRGPDLLRSMRPIWHLGVAGGIISVAAYALVLWAQTQGALASVAALRETGVIAGAIIGALVFHERFGRVRTVATIVVVAGIVLLQFRA